MRIPASVIRLIIFGPQVDACVYKVSSITKWMFDQIVCKFLKSKVQMILNNN